MSRARALSHDKQPHVLFAILDWGLGHATRTWPLMVAARRLGARVTIASRGAAGRWLDARMAEWDERHAGDAWPRWDRVEKPGTTIRYAKGIGTLPRIALQMPAFIRSIGEERRWTTGHAMTHGVTHIFSDNCYGARAELDGVSNVFMSHQLQPPVPLVAKDLARRMVMRYVAAFDEVWVPDTPDHALAGALAHPISDFTRYVGPLSRFQVLDASERVDKDEPVLLGLVSGPEPQRSAMEDALRTCFAKDGRSALILSGKPGGREERQGNVLTVPDADDHRFRAAVLSAEFIVCRSGYSTLLDLAVLGRKAILVPTIGQPEQEKLAREWSAKYGWHVLHASDLANFTPGTEGMPGVHVRVTAPGPEAEMREWLQTRNAHAPIPLSP